LQIRALSTLDGSDFGWLKAVVHNKAQQREIEQ
jgi:hypothetical protein